MTRAEFIDLLHAHDAEFKDDEILVSKEHEDVFIDAVGTKGLMLGKIPVRFQ